MPMTTDEIRERYLSFFEEHGHKRLPSFPLIPPAGDTSTLLIIAGMQPLKPWLSGRETPPHNRLTDAQKVFRTPDIEEVGSTSRHLTFFEMMGNFSIGDYFKEGATRFAWDLSIEGFGLNPDDIWVTVFEGDPELGIGLDEEAVDAWLEIGVPRERIVPCNRKENFWESGPTGLCGPCSELYLDRGLDFGKADDLPGGDNERFMEYWNLVFMQYDQEPRNTLTPLPAKNIDTGLGLERLASLLQGVPSVFETDAFRPLVGLGEELSGRAYGSDFPTDRALRILADHARGMSFLLADGVVPSNEGRGYPLRRIMRRAIVQGRRLGIEGQILAPFAARVRDVMGSAYPELGQQQETIEMWLGREEEQFTRTLEQGTRLLNDHIARAKDRGLEGIGAEDAFQLHDTYGFPFELTAELAAEQDMGVDEAGFEREMESARARARSAGTGGRAAGDGGRDAIEAFASGAGFSTEFTGYETTEQATAVGAITRANGHLLAKLVESPFYATGGGQVADAGEVRCEDGGCAARVLDVVRLGDDQALVLEPIEGELHEGERVVARVDAPARRATQANHTATHLLHAALRERLGGHVRQAGSYVGPDKLRFDFTHGAPLSDEDRAWVEDRVNEQILANDPVRALTTTLDEARALGAMALFGEKYGDVVRMVEIGDGQWSRELCGGTHVRSTAEIGVFKLTTETSSAANVRRIEAVTGPVAVDLLRRNDRLLHDAALALRTAPENVADVAAEREAERRALLKGAKTAAPVDDKIGEVVELDGVRAAFELRDLGDPKALPDLADRMKNQLGDPGVVVLGAGGEGKASLLVAATPGAVERGVRAGEIVKVAAKVVGGGGGGRDTMAQAGGKQPDKLPEALAAARAEIERALGAG
jgi:alanyl-tRNA synthetase